MNRHGGTAVALEPDAIARRSGESCQCPTGCGNLLAFDTDHDGRLVERCPRCDARWRRVVPCLAAPAVEVAHLRIPRGARNRPVVELRAPGIAMLAALPPIGQWVAFADLARALGKRDKKERDNLRQGLAYLARTGRCRLRRGTATKFGGVPSEYARMGT